QPTKRAVTVAVVALLLGIAGTYLLKSAPLGVNVSLWVCALIVSVSLLAPRTVASGGLWLLLTLPIIAASAGFMWRESSVLKWLDGLVLAGSLALALMGWRELRVPVAGTIEYLTGMLRVAGAALYSAFPIVTRDIEW